ncbi:hypothetical protein H6G20_05965 [Desertifilum sp. FACHB-1129]|uniref:hypothetical protein n=1 Tax=unclassified Desertifilum TaxID=2621682 RepID=UPI0016873301|nr:MULTISPECIES: hypothetical protein [unclassified Desertifilum]MBD2311203.1 hypothetical protein [Desertifilum sp. FACHB-1129]MBD2324352.1 hypothetical protein [Desertifilum sp. FACHB-866]MBD2334366.1 hypothetical protein [Desertifilum sp. FACHB-868]MDA0213213.1 hypothetical protein [Cyanobacteria bacterium FC1]
MQYSFIRHFRNASLFLIFGLPSILGTTHSLAAAQVPNEVTAPADKPVMVANLSDVLRTIQTIKETVEDGQAPSSRPRTRTPQSTPRVRTEMRQERLNQIRQRSRDFAEERQRRLAEDAAQREERRQQREAYLQSLSPEQRAAFLEAEREQKNAMQRMMIEGWLLMEESNANAPERPNNRQGMSETEWACYINPSCGR